MAKADLPEIPERLSFKIGEVSRLVGVKPHVLRFWESEFGRIRPQKARNGHRIYSRSDVELLRRVRALLHERKYTIAGARALLQEGEAAVEAVLRAVPTETAVALDEVEAAREALVAQLDEARARVVEAERARAAAEDEAAFWRGEARKAEALLSRASSRLGVHVRALKEIGRSR